MIQLLIEGRLPIVADGQMELPKQPPFDVLTPGPAAIIHLQLEPESPNCIKIFDHLYATGVDVDVVAHDGEAKWIRAAMQCVGVEHHQGIQTTRAWSEPLRHAQVDGHCALYRPSPRFQPISRAVHRYVLEALRYREVDPIPMKAAEHDSRIQ